MKNALLALTVLALLSGCAAPERQPEAPAAANECISACQKAMLGGSELSSGPCLLDPIPRYPDWVCDVAHSPRLLVDDVVGNQCDAYLAGTATHFIEVTPDCKFIREG